VTYRVRVQFTHDGPAVTGEWSVSDPPTGHTRANEPVGGMGTVSTCDATTPIPGLPSARDAFD
jgi:hypothetical protein